MANAVKPNPAAPHHIPASAIARPANRPPERRTWPSANQPRPTAAPPVSAARIANAPPTSGPQPSFAPANPKQPTTIDTRIDAIPATRLPTAWPEVVGGTVKYASPNSVPGTGSTLAGAEIGCGGGGAAKPPG